MICGQIICSHCGTIDGVVNPNQGEQICYDCGSYSSYQQKHCGSCGSERTKKILLLSGQADEICPRCKKGVLDFCI